MGKILLKNMLFHELTWKKNWYKIALVLCAKPFACQKYLVF